MSKCGLINDTQLQLKEKRINAFVTNLFFCKEDAYKMYDIVHFWGRMLKHNYIVKLKYSWLTKKNSVFVTWYLVFPNHISIIFFYYYLFFQSVYPYYLVLIVFESVQYSNKGTGIVVNLSLFELENIIWSTLVHAHFGVVYGVVIWNVISLYICSYNLNWWSVILFSYLQDHQTVLESAEAECRTLLHRLLPHVPLPTDQVP